MSSTARTLMIQGTSSDVGKSLLVAAYCRVYARRGIRAAPFKSQNMALNSYAGSDGAEIGRAQALQAMAAGLEPRADMNPVLLKTEADSRSQVVVMGKPWLTLEGRDYLSLRAEVWPIVCGAMDRMCADFDLVIAEGAGSPAEINLNDREIVNMSVARYLDAPVILAADIDRGGVFASLVGTLALLDDGDAQRVRGFLINKFRGDVSLLGNGLEMLSERTAGRPTLGVIPWIHGLQLAQEDSVAVEGLGGLGNWRRTVGEGDVDIVVPRFPRMANFDDLDALAMEEGVGIRFIESPAELGRPDAVLLPGSKTTIRDLEWLRKAGLAERIRNLADSGVPVVGICGGFQMMGRDITDETGIEGSPGRSAGLGILNVRTVFQAVKRTRPVWARVSGEASAMDGAVRGYEIHMGRTRLGEGVRPLFDLLDEVTGEPIGPDGAIADGALAGGGRHWGTYLHGVFDEPAFRRSWLESLGWRLRGKARSLGEERESELNRLADTVEEATDMDKLDRIVGI